MNYVRRKLWALSLTGLLAACGGGSSGGGDSSAPQQPDPAPVRDETKLEQAANTALYGISVSESLLQLAQSAVRYAVDTQLLLSGLSVDPTAQCTGNNQFSINDLDGDQRLGTGDSIKIVSEYCQNSILEADVNGSFSLHITQVDSAGDGTVYASILMKFDPDSQLSVVSEDVVTRISGELQVDYQLGDNEERFILNSSQITLESASIPEVVTSFALTRSLQIEDGDMREYGAVDISLSLAADSGLLGDVITCEAGNLQFLQPVSSTMSVSDYQCAGSFGEVKITASENIDIKLVGEETFQRTYTLEQGALYEGAMYSWPLYQPSALEFQYASRVLLEGAELMLEDLGRQRVVLVQALDTEAGQYAWSSYSEAGGLERQSTLNYLPARIALNADGSELLALNHASGEIVRYNAESFVEIGIIRDFEPISDFAPSTIDPDVIAVISGPAQIGNKQLVILDTGAPLTDKVDFALFGETAEVFQFDPSGRSLVLKNGGMATYTVNETGVQASRIYSDVDSNLNGEFFDDRYLLGGSVYDPATFARRGNFYGITNESFALAPEKSLAFFAKTALEVCDLDYYRCFTSVAGRSDRFRNAKLAVLGEELLIVTPARLEIFEIPEFGFPELAPCDLEPMIVDQQTVYRADCLVQDAVYDDVTDRTFLLSNGGVGPYAEGLANIIEISVGDKQVIQHAVPGMPENLGLSADASTLYFHHPKTSIGRIDTASWQTLSPILLQPELSGDRLYDLRVWDFKLSPVDIDFLLLDRDVSEVPVGGTVGIDGEVLISASSPTDTRAFRFDSAGAIYAGYTWGVNEYVLNGNELNFVQTFDYPELCDLIEPAEPGFMLSRCGQLVRLVDGSIVYTLLQDLSFQQDNPSSRLVDVERDLIYLLYTSQYSNQAAIVKYQYSTGDRLGVFEAPVEISWSKAELAFVSNSGAVGVVAETAGDGEMLLIPDALFIDASN
ncbi:hypothetical protein [Microbulbifer agarilyticus]|uniref:hypothetical protein n=1 Tax=Microbulbifer agarilyticus TaxID=260552 RepID=UPI001CD56778|nr:hypothetical protein [Microbulbifer agarilyticus]MCA0893494.1 hypothetical protein [Microbulbifer agarilyticus]